MIFQIYGRAFKALMKQPIRLIGLSLFGILVTGLGSALFSIPPGLSVAISLLFSAALAQIFLRSYRGELCNTQDMFATFKGKDILKRTLGGMAWRELWLFIWALIPIAGIVFVIIKSYTYRLTPYILMNEEDVKPMDAIKVSKARTAGYRGKMFLADILPIILVYVVALILMLLVRIPYIGILFGIVLVLFFIAWIALGPLFLGLVQAAFYEEIMNPTIPLTAPVQNYAQPVYPAQQGFEQPVYPAQQQTPFTAPPVPVAPVVPAAPVTPAAPAAPAEPFAPAAPIAPEAPQAPAAPMFRFCTNCGTRYDASQTRICPNCGNKDE